MNPIENRYPGKCSWCGTQVGPGVGLAIKVRGRWVIYCRAKGHVPHVREDGSEGPMLRAFPAPRVVAFTFAESGETVYRNAKGRCEDAPCCGCCT